LSRSGGDLEDRSQGSSAGQGVSETLSEPRQVDLWGGFREADNGSARGQNQKAGHRGRSRIATGEHAGRQDAEQGTDPETGRQQARAPNA
jgi:hypothetical protein